MGSRYLVVLLILLAANVAAFGLQYFLPIGNLSLVFMTAVLWVAAQYGIGPALVAVMVSFLSYNFFFTEPRLTFHIMRSEELATVLFFLLVSVVTGHIASRLRLQLQRLKLSNAQTEALLDFSRCLASASTSHAICEAAAGSIDRYLNTTVTIQYRLGVDQEWAITGPELSPALHKQITELIHSRQPHLELKVGNTRMHCLTLRHDDQWLGVLAIRLQPETMLPVGQGRLPLLEAYASQLSMALMRAYLDQTLNDARLSEETERLRATLLSSVSHDLRTPLASIIGAASSVRDLSDTLTPENKKELLDTVLAEGQRLDRYIQNLLDMTRLANGQLQLKKDWISAQDLIAGALRRSYIDEATLTVERRIAPMLPLLYNNPALMEQALINVLDNAKRYSPAGGHIWVEVSQTREQGVVTISVTDEGPGIEANQRLKIFETFFRGERGDQDSNGSGLGLAICKSVLEVHGGSAEAKPGRQGSGMCIALYIPLHLSQESPFQPDDDTSGPDKNTSEIKL
ncbi:MAG: DUF4118 domain-containing protein [Marinobacter sp.]|uniref:sensor histidine kinase n=1 Tax=Marinobacter sp. TaxID=50741 RepID=UPI0034A02511